MITKKYEMDISIIDALRTEVTEKNLPVHIQTGISFISECGNEMMPVQVDCADDYADELGRVISRVINKTYCLT